MTLPFRLPVRASEASAGECNVTTIGGGEYIPEYDAGSRTIGEAMIRTDDQQTLNTVGETTDEADAAANESTTES